ncbi:SnoaL-like domain-containing protein [Chitinophaga sp. Cy-1792]|uniref:SnoaL-like domain-containing protein n=1 Tax=Chitinophaga sp. Cy-1792 TaxID=2608339 RepID=UPI0014213F9F|nr:SnoaL-like domain-containing protein [Chitinophaga sp. Cy-1792]NIG53797.1 nuclear transport factor 2 family protein [Chitinophaga sp. Cy-1792]
MTTAAIAARLIELCSKGDFEAAQKELYAENAVSIEPYATPAFEKETHGLKGIYAKGEKFESMVEKYHDISFSQPLVAGKSFTVVLNMDLTMKGQDRMQMSEICVYVTKDGKIISEQFFM